MTPGGSYFTDNLTAIFLDDFCSCPPVVPGITGKRCDSSDGVNEGFGESFDTANEAAARFDTNFDVNMQYEV